MAKMTNYPGRRGGQRLGQARKATDAPGGGAQSLGRFDRLGGPRPKHPGLQRLSQNIKLRDATSQLRGGQGSARGPQRSPAPQAPARPDPQTSFHPWGGGFTPFPMQMPQFPGFPQMGPYPWPPAPSAGVGGIPMFPRFY